MKPLFPTADNTLNKELRFDNVLMLGACGGERTILKFVLRYGSWKLVIVASFCCEVLF